MATKLIADHRRRPSKEAMKALTDQQLCFVNELLGSSMFDPTEAARKAKYSNPQKASYKLLNQPNIRLALGRAQRLRNERAEITNERVLQEVDYCAMRDPIDLCDENGLIRVNDLRQIPEAMRRCIDGIKIKQFKRYDPETGQESIEQVIELKLAGKIAALELSMRHRGLLDVKESETGKQQVNWDAMSREEILVDPIEQRLLEEQG